MAKPCQQDEQRSACRHSVDSRGDENARTDQKLHGYELCRRTEELERGTRGRRKTVGEGHCEIVCESYVPCLCMISKFTRVSK